MKKIVFLLAVLGTCFTMTSCDTKQDDQSRDDQSQKDQSWGDKPWNEQAQSDPSHDQNGCRCFNCRCGSNYNASDCQCGPGCKCK